MNILKRLCSAKLAAHVRSEQARGGSTSAPKSRKTRPFTRNNRSFYAHFGARNHKDTPGHLLLPSTGPVMNSLPSTLRFHLTFISYANAVRRKTFVTGFNVQPSSFVSLLLCQTPKRSSPLCLPTFGNKVLVKSKTTKRFPPNLPDLEAPLWACVSPTRPRFGTG